MVSVHSLMIAVPLKNVMAPRKPSNRFYTDISFSRVRLVQVLAVLDQRAFAQNFQTKRQNPCTNLPTGFLKKPKYANLTILTVFLSLTLGNFSLATVRVRAHGLLVRFLYPLRFWKKKWAKKAIEGNVLQPFRRRNFTKQRCDYFAAH